MLFIITLRACYSPVRFFISVTSILMELFWSDFYQTSVVYDLPYQPRRREAMLFHHQSIKELPPAESLIIENVHNLLEKYLSNLRNACACSNLGKLSDPQTLDHEKHTSCQGRLPSYLFYVIELAAKHFDHEETIMLSRPHVTEDDEYFRMHQQAHTDIMEKLNALVDEYLPLGNQSIAAKIYIKFYKKLSDLFTEHNSSFKDPFYIQSRIKSELSVVG